MRRMLDGSKICKMIDFRKQGKIDINIESLRRIIGRMPSWNLPRPSKVKQCLDEGFGPSWLTKGRTVLDMSKGNIANNYRCITYILLAWKLVTNIIADKIYDHLTQQHLLPEKQKECRKSSM